jgi:hypothetical protein
LVLLDIFIFFILLIVWMYHFFFYWLLKVNSQVVFSEKPSYNNRILLTTFSLFSVIFSRKPELYALRTNSIFEKQTNEKLWTLKPRVSDV